MKNDCLSELNNKAGEAILSLPKATSIRVISHYDADGITAATIVCIALLRQGYNFQVTLMQNPFSEGFRRLNDEENELIIFCDMGSGQIKEIEKLGCKAIICDHHQPLIKKNVSGKILQINAHLCNIDGAREASGSTMAFSLVTIINRENKDLLALALTGATGDKQHLGGFKGYNKELLEEALKEEVIEVSNDWLTPDECVFDEIYYSIDPFYSGLSGRKDEINKMLTNLKISGDKKVDDLSDHSKKRLKSILTLKLLKQGCNKDVIKNVTSNKYWVESLNTTLERFAELLDACAKQGKQGLGLSICLGDDNALDKAFEMRRSFRQKVLEGLCKIEDEGTKKLETLQYFYATNASLGGVIGGTAINYCLDQTKPILSLTRKNDEIHISARGNNFLIEKGIDLGSALKKAAKKFNGNGGGHNIAAGAVIDEKFEKEFLDEVNKVITEQLTI